MIDAKKIFDTLIVVKRSGQRTEFNGEKIAIAIKKAFDSVDQTYFQEDVNKVYQKVLDTIEKDYQDRKTIKIEDIQDIIEEQLKKLKFTKVYESFSNYREQRAASREIFVIKQQHKFLKAIENLGFNNLYEKESGKLNHLEEKSSIEVLNNFGVTISKEFAKAYLIDNKYIRSHEDGLIHIHHLETFATGTTQSISLDLERIYKNGFSLGFQDFTLPTSIEDAVHQIIYLMQGIKNDQCGNQGIGAIDFYLSPYIIKSFQKTYYQIIIQFLRKDGFLDFINEEKILREIEKEVVLKKPEMLLYLENEAIQKIFDNSYKIALSMIKEESKKAISYLLENMNILSTKDHFQLSTVSFSFGTDCSEAGRLISKCFLEKVKEMDCLAYPVVFFKLKKGINFWESDINYDLFLMSLECVQNKNFYYTLLDPSYNRSISSENEVSYLPFGERVIEDITLSEESRTSGKGTVSTTSINLPRIAIRHGVCLDQECNVNLNSFYEELEETMDLVRDQMLERFEIQCSKHSYNFPFLIEQGIWLDGDKVKQNDRLRKILKHGCLAIHFTGFAEMLKALFGKHHGEELEIYKQGQKILQFMKKKVEDYSNESNLNFVLTGISYPDVNERFLNIDKAIYGKIKGVTDKTKYTVSFQIPDDSRIKLDDRIVREGSFYQYVLGGSVFTIEIEKSKFEDIVFIKKMLDKCLNEGIGCITFCEK